MKKLQNILTVLCCLFAFSNAEAQLNITRVEYFIDTDPGFGAALSIPVAAAPDIADFSVSIPLASATEGFHNLFLRSLDANGNWSVTNKTAFYKTVFSALPNILKAEYFIDADPGFGAGNNIPVTASSNLQDRSVVIPLAGVSDGFHNVYIRSLDANGRWSVTNKMAFYKTVSRALPNIVKAEYFIDTDPGFGAATSITVTASGNIDDGSVIIPLTGVSDGFHNVYIRSLDANGRWSVTNKMAFYKTMSSALPNIVKAEYFIDTDPGFGAATSIPVTASGNIEDGSVVIPLEAVSEGLHNLYIRSLDADGYWSVTNKLAFYKSVSTSLPNIVKAEYFIDIDPGFGLANNIPVMAASNISNLPFNADLTGITAGFHRFYIRSLDADGKWSITNIDTFTISSTVIPTVTIGNVPNTVCAGENMQVTYTVNTRFSTGNTFTAQLSAANGSFASPVIIGSIQSDTSGTINCIIPAAAASGNGYRIRIVSNAPVSTSRESADIVTINRIPGSSYSINGPAQTCTVPQVYAVSNFDAGSSYAWQLSGGGTLTPNGSSATVSWTSAGTDTLKVTATNNCGTGPAVQLIVQVFAAAPAFTPAITVNNRQLTATFVSTAQGVTGFQWFKDGVLISGQTAQNYIVPDNETGSYTVAYTNACGTGSQSAPVLITVVRNNQVITFSPQSAKTYGDPAFVVRAVASSGLPVQYSIVSGPGSITDSTVTITGAGVIAVGAFQEGNASFNPATATLPVLVNKAAAAIALSNLEYVYDGTGKSATVTTLPPGLNTAVTYNGSFALPVNAAVYAVSASITSANYQGSKDSSLQISKASQTINLQSIPNKNFNDAAFTVSAAASSGLPVTLSIVTVPASGVASINGNVISILGGGTVTVTASQAGNQNYNPATAQTSFSINPPLANDLAPVRLLSPASGCGLGTAPAVTVTIRNAGTAAATGFTVGYRLDDNAPVTETFSSSIPAGEERDFTFTTPVAIPNGNQLYQLTIFTALTADQRPSNDTLSEAVIRLLPGVSTVSLDTAICAGGSATLRAAGGSAYQWVGGPAAAMYTVSPAVSTTYEVQITDINSCGTRTGFVTVTVSPLPLVNAGPDQSMLRGSSVTLTGTGTGNLLWSNGAAGNSTVVSPGITTSYSLTATSLQGCSATDTMTVTVNFSALTVSPGLWDFGSVVQDSAVIKNIVITNTGTLTETIDSLAGLELPFSTTFAGPVSLPPGTSYSIPVRFVPAALLIYQGIPRLHTSAGNFDITLQGRGVVAAPAWSVTPSSYDFGRVERGQLVTKQFTIRNTGNVPIRISTISTTSPRFVGTTLGITQLPVGGTITLSVRFTPTAIETYSGLINIRTSTLNLGLLKVIVTGTGYVKASPPELLFQPDLPYNGITGVNPAVAPPGLFTYGIIYRHPNGTAPMTGFPKMGIDKNGDGDFADAGEGVYTLTKVSNTSQWLAGEKYTYATDLPASDLYGYQFFATDSLGNLAVTGIDYNNGPVVTRDILDLHIYASDIVFSNQRPNPGEPFTVTATIHNNSDYSASGVPVRFYYKDSIYLFEDTIPYIDANSSVALTRPLSFSPDGYYPVKVWIDSARVLGEGNILNNYASRAVLVGAFTLPGAIIASASASTSVCNKGKTNFGGVATYTGLNLEGTPQVEGATVTLKIYTPEETIYTLHTDIKGEWSFRFDPCASDPDPVTCEGLPCGVPYTYSVQVTDYTLTSALYQSTFIIPCANCNQVGEIQHSGGPALNCTQDNKGYLLENESFTHTLTIENFSWTRFQRLCAPTVYRDTIEIYRDGELQQTHILDSIATCSRVSFTDTIAGLPLGSHSTSYTHVYYTANGERREITGSTNFEVLVPLADLSLEGISKTGHTAFAFLDKNTACGVPAGLHMIYLYDSMPGYTESILLDSFIVNAVLPRSSFYINYNRPGWATGPHYLTIVTDVKNTVAELREDNNTLTALFIVEELKPDISVSGISISNSNLSQGSLVNFTARIKNQVLPVSIPFKVAFKVDGMPLGSAINIPSLNAGAEVMVVSTPYTVPSNPCPQQITIFADVDTVVNESNEKNNADTTLLGINIQAGRRCDDINDNAGAGFFSDNTTDPNAISLCGPYIAPKGILTYFETTVRNSGTRNANNIRVQFKWNGQVIGTDVIPSLRAGEKTNSGFFYAFDTVGRFIINAFADYTGEICEISESDNVGRIHVDARTTIGDLHILSQFISPSNLNPDPGQYITVASSVVNMGDAPVGPTKIKFFVDDVVLGSLIPIDSLYPGQDTTVLATALYASGIVGPKVIKVRVDAENRQPERNERNNEATRAIIVGGAPDFANSLFEAITLSQGSFAIGDSITICNYVRNFGGDEGTAWMRFYYTRANGEKVLIDSVAFTMNQNDSFKVCTRWLVTEPSGLIITEIDHSNPPEFDTLNNKDTLFFGTVIPLTLLSFTGDISNLYAALQWNTANEFNLARFEVERSTNGSVYTPVGVVNALNINGTNRYVYTDSGFLNLPAGPVYYRLKINDRDGQYRYSPVVVLNKKQVSDNIVLFPNPVKNVLYIQVTAAASSKYSIQLLDVAGKQLLSGQYRVLQGQQAIPLAVGGYAKGLYLLLLTNEKGERVQLKFVKE